jgi:hypothetical protein
MRWAIGRTAPEVTGCGTPVSLRRRNGSARHIAAATGGKSSRSRGASMKRRRTMTGKPSAARRPLRARRKHHPDKNNRGCRQTPHGSILRPIGISRRRFFPYMEGQRIHPCI